MDDFSPFRYYPQTKYNMPTLFQSHAEFLQAAALRYNIGKALHSLNVEQLKTVLEFVKNANIFYTVVAGAFE